MGPDGLPLCGVCRLHAFGLGLGDGLTVVSDEFADERVVLLEDEARRPEQHGEQAHHQESERLPVPVYEQSADQREHQHDDDVAVEAVEHAVVVELGRAQYSAAAVAVGVEALTARDHERHAGSRGQHNQVPDATVVPELALWQLLGQYQHPGHARPQVNVPREERQELLLGRDRQQPALADDTDDEHHARSDSQPDDHRLDDAVIRQPPKARQ